jgi:hypothetical protein
MNSENFVNIHLVDKEGIKNLNNNYIEHLLDMEDEDILDISSINKKSLSVSSILTSNINKSLTNR